MIILQGPDHFQNEDHFIILGLSKLLNILVVCHWYKENDNVIGIIYARKATQKERKQYGGV